MGFIRARSGSAIVQILPGLRLSIQSGALRWGFVLATALTDAASAIFRAPRARLRAWLSSRALRLLSRLARPIPRSRVLTAAALFYYRVAVRALRLQTLSANPIPFSIFTRHQDWEPPWSDIDVIVVYEDTEGTAEDLRAFFDDFFEAHGLLRILFPILCPAHEVRFFASSMLTAHPRLAHPEAMLLYSPKTWRKATSTRRSPELPAPVDAVAPVAPADAGPEPLSRHVELALYRFLQGSLLTNLRPGDLRTPRIPKSLLRCLHHTCLWKTGESRSMAELRRSLSDGKDPRLEQESKVFGAALAARTLADHTDVLRDLLLLLDEIHAARLPGVGEQVQGDSQILPPTITAFIRDFRRRFDLAPFVVLRQEVPLHFEWQVFVVMSRTTKAEAFRAWADFIRGYSKQFRDRRIAIACTTEVLLTSQLYFLWGESPLEPVQFSDSKNVATGEDAQLRVLQPKPEWLYEKLREAVANVAESKVPHELYGTLSGLEESLSHRALEQYRAFLGAEDEPADGGAGAFPSVLLRRCRSLDASLRARLE